RERDGSGHERAVCEAASGAGLGPGEEGKQLSLVSVCLREGAGGGLLPPSPLSLPPPPECPVEGFPMTAWLILPVSLSAFSITGIWIVLYNESCSEETTKQDYPKSCCTVQDIPLVSKCGSYPPESCLFSLIGNVGAFMVVVICVLRYGQILERCRPTWINTGALVTGCINAVGLIMVGNFQVRPPVF
ncbi:hypothetical protein chiPu_0020526, partial [Chiloscyllium punctatum]|nr:hypothetical protein [Chiloscyllium punctatum]